jgi:hypothetical protein
VRSYVKGKAAGFDPTKLTVESSWPDNDNEPGSRVQVTTSHPMPLTITKFFFPAGCGGPPLECKGVAVRRIVRH